MFTQPSSSLFQPQKNACLQVITPDGKEGGYILGTCHYYYSIPPQLEEKFENGTINHVVVEVDDPSVKESKFLKLDHKIAFVAHQKNLKVTSLEIQEEKKNLIAAEKFAAAFLDIFYFFSPFASYCVQTVLVMSKTKSYQLYIKQEIEELFTILHESDFNSNLLLSQRNEIWGDTIDQAFKQGKTLVAVGIYHLYGEKGIVPFLTSKGYLLKPFPVTISLDDKITHPEFEEFLMERALESSVYWAKFVSPILSQLISAFTTEKELTNQKRNILNKILHLLFPTFQSGEKALAFFTKNPSKGFLKLFEMYKYPLNNYKFSNIFIEDKLLDFLHELRELYKDYNHDEYKLFLGRAEVQSDPHLYSVTLEDYQEGQISKLKMQETCHHFIFYCGLFYPEIVKGILDQYINDFFSLKKDEAEEEIQAMRSGADLNVINLMLNCGITLSNGKHLQYAECYNPDYLSNHQPDYLFKLQKYTLTGNLKKEEKENKAITVLSLFKKTDTNKNIIENIYSFLDPQSKGNKKIKR